MLDYIDAVKDLIDLLNAVKSNDTKKFYPTVGICSQVYLLVPLRDAFRAWPKYSGDVIYPVSVNYNKTGSCTAYREYHEAKNTGTMWVGEYGKLRIELLEFLIQYYIGILREHYEATGEKVIVDFLDVIDIVYLSKDV